jgi:uncharacterized protein (TIGR01777 family)
VSDVQAASAETGDMKIVVTGGTGFLGQPLCRTLADDEHDVTVFTRGQPTGSSVRKDGLTLFGWSPDRDGGDWQKQIDGADAVINLAGEPIAARRWTEAHKARIRSSRMVVTQNIVRAIAAAAKPPAVLISGSAVGYYGARGDERITEDAPAGTDFLASVCQEWEDAARSAEQPGTRVALVRTGLVLERDGGALERMLPPFRFFGGGPLGSGRQYWPWIHRADWIGIVRWLLVAAHATGPFNATGPNPVTNREFSAALGRALKRPSWLPAPPFALRIALGEMADALLLSGQRAVPERPLRMGYRFQFERVDDALRSILT